VSHYEGEELYESEFKYLVKYEERQRLLMQLHFVCKICVGK